MGWTGWLWRGLIILAYTLVGYVIGGAIDMAAVLSPYFRAVSMLMAACYWLGSPLGAAFGIWVTREIRPGNPQAQAVIGRQALTLVLLYVGGIAGGWAGFVVGERYSQAWQAAHPEIFTARNISVLMGDPTPLIGAYVGAALGALLLALSTFTVLRRRASIR